MVDADHKAVEKGHKSTFHRCPHCGEPIDAWLDFNVRGTQLDSMKFSIDLQKAE